MQVAGFCLSTHGSQARRKTINGCRDKVYSLEMDPPREPEQRKCGGRGSVTFPGRRILLEEFARLDSQMWVFFLVHALQRERICC